MEYKLEPPKYLFIEELAKPKPPSINVLEHKQCVGNKHEGIAASNVNWKVDYPIYAPPGSFDNFESYLADVMEIEDF